MMEWEAIAEGMDDLVTDLTDLVEPDAVLWDWEAARVEWRPFPRATLSMVSVVPIGIDEERRSHPGGNAQQLVAMVGQRIVTVQLRVDTDDGDHALLARTIAAKVQDRMWRTTSLSRLRTFGVALSTVRDLGDQDFADDSKVYSVALLEIVLLASAVEADDTAGAGDWIRRVQLISDKLRGTDGVDLPADLQVDEEIGT
jgi:hypothetical protein